MELILNFSSFPLVFISLVFIFLVLRTLSKTKRAKKLPPGPWKLPVLGSLHHLITSLPHRRLAELAKIHGPIMHLQLGQLTNIIISSPQAAKEVMKTHDVSFCDRPHLMALSIATYNLMDIAFAPYGDYWRQLRKICTVELMSTHRVNSFRPIREEQVSKLIRSIHSHSVAGSPVNLCSMAISLAYSIVSKTAFGKVWDVEHEVIAAAKDLVDASGGFSLVDLYPSVKLFQLFDTGISKVKKHKVKIDKILQSIIDEHRARREPGNNTADEEDLLDVLLNVQEQGDLQFPLTDDNIKAIMLDIFNGGIETSSTTLEWIMSELMKNPFAMEKAQKEVRRVFNDKKTIVESRLHELEYLKMIIKESLRLHPPFSLLMPRESREECSINGYDIPVKSKVIVNVWAIGRDTNYWTDAEKFIPERFFDSSIDYKGNDFELLPFGSGRRICPGLTFGMINVEYPLAQLLYHFDWKLPSGITHENLDMNESFGMVVKRKHDLHLIPIPYHHSNEGI